MKGSNNHRKKFTFWARKSTKVNRTVPLAVCSSEPHREGLEVEILDV